MFQEEYVRADAYGLISQLFSSPPDAAFLKLYSGAPDAGTAEDAPQFTLQEAEPVGYEAALKRLQAAATGRDATAVAAEFERMFRSGEASLSTPGALAPAGQIAALRSYLAQYGLAPRASSAAVEGYVASICDVMRWLIEHDRPMGVQAGFFNDFVQPGVTTLCDAIEATPGASFYASVADLARTFMESESVRFRAYE